MPNGSWSPAGPHMQSCAGCMKPLRYFGSGVQLLTDPFSISGKKRLKHVHKPSCLFFQEVQQEGKWSIALEASKFFRTWPYKMLAPHICSFSNHKALKRAKVPGRMWEHGAKSEGAVLCGELHYFGCLPSSTLSLQRRASVQGLCGAKNRLILFGQMSTRETKRG